MYSQKHQSLKREFKISRKPVVIGSFLIIVVFYVFLTIQTVTSGTKLATLEKESTDLSSKNRELTAELIKTTSLTNLSEVSENLGFVRPEKTIYLTHEVTAARLP